MVNKNSTGVHVAAMIADEGCVDYGRQGLRMIGRTAGTERSATRTGRGRGKGKIYDGI